MSPDGRPVLRVHALKLGALPRRSGQHLPLEWASSPGFALSPGALPYAQTEAAAGAHSLTRMLVRAAASQYSPEAQSTWQPVSSAAALEQKVKRAFELGQPVPLLIFFSGEGHAMLAYNYQTTPEGGVDVDVIDPNVPFGEAPWQRSEAEAFPQLQVKMKPNGSWEFAGSFTGFFTDHVGGGPGDLDVIPEPRLPGHLLLPSSSPLAHLFTYIHPPAGATVSAISYGTDRRTRDPGRRGTSPTDRRRIRRQPDDRALKASHQRYRIYSR